MEQFNSKYKKRKFIPKTDFNENSVKLFKRVSLVPNKFDFEAIHKFNQQNNLINGK